MQAWLRRIVVPGVLLAAAGGVFAQDPPGTRAPAAAGGASAVGQSETARLRKAQDRVLRMLGSGSLERLDKNQQADLARALQELQAVLPANGQDRASPQMLRPGNASSVALDIGDGLRDYQRSDLSLALGEIRSALLADESSRLTCHYERKTGTNLVALRCETIAEREQHARESQEALREAVVGGSRPRR